MEFEDLRIGHRVKCVKENELLPFKANTEYEIVNVKEGTIDIKEDKTENVYPLDMPICLNYFEFSPTVVVVTGFRRHYVNQSNEIEMSKKENKEENKEEAISSTEEFYYTILESCKEDKNVFTNLSREFGLTASIIKLTESIEKIKEQLSGGDCAYDTLTEYFTEICKTSVLTINYLNGAH